MSNGPRTHMAEVIGDTTPIPLPPPTPPRVKSIGPDVWWNPLSPKFPPNAASAAILDAARKKTAAKADELSRQIDAMTDAVDPVLAAETLIGRPSWGYHVPTVAIGVGSLVVLGVVGSLVYRAKKRK